MLPSTIIPLRDEADLNHCARLMSESEPWLTLKRDYEASRKVIGTGGKEVYLALDAEGEIAGFIVLNMQGAFVGYVQTICIDPPYRSQGIGSALLKFAEERIFRQSPNVFMCVSSFNPNARRLYEKLGYEAIGELKDYLVAGHSEILLRKTIGALTEFKPSKSET